MKYEFRACSFLWCERFSFNWLIATYKLKKPEVDPESIMKPKKLLKRLFTPSESGSESEKVQRTSEIKSKNKWQASKKIFAFAFTFARSEYSLDLTKNRMLV